MGYITYRVSRGELPVTVTLQGSDFEPNVHAEYGDYYFNYIPEGSYTLHFIDALGCEEILGVFDCPNCPEGYTATADGCYIKEDIDATPPTFNYLTYVSKTYSEYSKFGSLIYEEGFNIDGTGSYILIPTANPFWINGPQNTIAGPLNRTGIWSSGGHTSYQTIGFSICIDIRVEKLYYVGVGCDNEAKIRLDGVTILHQDRSIKSHYGTGGDKTFSYWHIYPVRIPAGFHILELEGYNQEHIAVFGAEVYSATPQELMDATGYTALGDKLIFSSKDMIGESIQLGSHGHGYSCPEGYALVLCDGDPYCTKLTYTACEEETETTTE